MNDLVVQAGGEAGLPAKLDLVRKALAEATTDFERVQVRDHAAAVAAAASILDRREIQTEASILVQDAERAIAQANPPKQGQRTDLGVQNPEVSPDLVREIRKAHSKLTDEQFEDVKAQARERLEPLTRKALKEVGSGASAAGAIRRGAAAGGGEVEWYTDPLVLSMAREVMGDIDLDPASCAIANEVVRADRFLTKADDAFASHWSGRVWLNPPYAPDLIKPFAEKLLEEVAMGRTTEACWLWPTGREDLPWCQDLMEAASALWMPKGRMKFRSSEGEVQASERPCMVLYLGPNRSKFVEVFSTQGVVWTRGGS